MFIEVIFEVFDKRHEEEKQTNKQTIKHTNTPTNKQTTTATESKHNQSWQKQENFASLLVMHHRHISSLHIIA